MKTKSSQPNVLFILADDLGYGDLSCFNYGLTNTPVLDNLVRESVCLDQHYSASALCAPARASLLTGKYPLRCGVTDTLCLSYMCNISPSEVTIGDIFKSAGYSTGLIGKWHSGPVHKVYHPNSRGFDEFAGFRAGCLDYYKWPIDYNGVWKENEGQYLTDLFSDEAVGFLRRHKDEPFFLHLSYNAPHGPLQVPQENVKPYLENGRNNQGVSHVYGMVDRLDAGIGRVLEELERLGLAENTIVVFTSDNGPQFGCGDDDWRLDRFNCGFRGSKGSVYEGGIRVPLTIRWPGGLTGGRNFHEMVHFVDWLPTLCSACDIELPKDLDIDGQDVLAVLRDEDGKVNPKRFWQWSRSAPTVSHNAAMRDGDWKLVRPGKDIANSVNGDKERDYSLYMEVELHPEEYKDGVPEAVCTPGFVGVEPLEPELFNLAADPLETNNLAQQHPERVRTMITELENWFEVQKKDLAIAQACIAETPKD